MQELEKLLERIRLKYNIETAPLRVGSKQIQVLQLADFESYLENLIETNDVGAMELPYWAKLWESSFILAYFLGKQPLIPWQRMLEIGAGMGIVGLYASLCGHNVTITDIEDDALLFARANVLLNGAQARVEKLDWNVKEIEERYEVIFGSEVIYDRKSYPVLVDFLRRALTPNGTIFLAKSTSLHAPKFFEELTRYFKFKHMVQTIRSGDESIQVSLYAIRFKDNLQD